MRFDFIPFITNPFVLLFITMLTGLAIGRIKIKSFELGTSGAIFMGLLLGWVVYKTYILPVSHFNEVPKYAAVIISDGMVPKYIFDLALILFVASVGLLAAKDIGRVLRLHGLKFLFMGISITLAGALGIFLAALLMGGHNPLVFVGAYTGALTSSPGLAAALEAASGRGVDAEALVGYGYAIAYAPGVLVVILCMKLLPLVIKIDIAAEKRKYIEDIGIVSGGSNGLEANDIDLLAFSLVCILGHIIGSVDLYFGSLIGFIRLGSTGGVLTIGLLLGYLGKVGPLNFRMNTKVLVAIREIGIAMFLASVGLRYGYDAISSLNGQGAMLAITSFIVGLFAILVGLALGKYVFRLNWIMLSGAICGGMTSTPGLGAAIDASGCDEAASGYGATYPFALMGMVIFTIILSKLV